MITEKIKRNSSEEDIYLDETYEIRRENKDTLHVSCFSKREAKFRAGWKTHTWRSAYYVTGEKQIEEFIREIKGLNVKPQKEPTFITT